VKEINKAKGKQKIVLNKFSGIFFVNKKGNKIIEANK